MDFESINPSSNLEGRTTVAAKCPLTDPVKSPYNGCDCYRRTSDTYKNNRRTTVEVRYAHAVEKPGVVII